MKRFQPFLFIILGFIIGCCTDCSCTRNGTSVRTYSGTPQRRLVIPADKAKEAAELYSKVFEARGQSGYSDGTSQAQQAVMTVYGVPE